VTQPPSPPALARWILERSVPADVCDAVAGDLDEMFAHDCRASGLAAARWRYRRQVLSFAARFALERGSPMRISWLDVKLGIRMLVRYPALTVVAGLAMAFAIAAGAATFEAVQRVTNPTLPLPEGERIVGLNYWDGRASTLVTPTAYDVLAWRDRLRTVENVGGFRLLQRNLGSEAGTGEPIAVAQISAAAFRVTRVPASLGRGLIDADERPGAPAVVVIGHRVWHARFAGDRAIVGRVVSLGGSSATVVGVMPEGFGFPMFHQVWIPLRIDPSQQPGGDGLRVFGRLAPGVTMAEAQAELATTTAQVVAAFPERHAQIRPQVLPYAESIIWIPPDFLVRAGIQSVNVFVVLLLGLVCGNVALLIFARAATRERELLVRSALGASRSRIVSQLFAEALVLGTLAALLGLGVTSLALRWGLEAMRDADLPFWFVDGLSTTTWTYAVVLTLLASAMAGVLPALKVTARGFGARLREASAGAGGLRMGGIWTLFIVGQIAVTVVFTGVAFVTQRQASMIAHTRASFPADQYLAVSLEMDEVSPDGAASTREAFLSDYSTTVHELRRRVAALPSVSGVTLAEQLPLMPHQQQRIELDDAEPSGAGDDRTSRIATTAVGLEFFETFQVQVLAGRSLTSQDEAPNASAVVVNRLFVERILKGRHAIGRRLRYVKTGVSPETGPEPWLEIVGVVGDLVLESGAPLRLDNPAKPVIYRLLSPTQVESHPLQLAARVNGDPLSLTPALRRIAADVAPDLRLTGVQPLDEATGTDARAWAIFARTILLGSAVAVLLSLAGIYSVVSFTVARRTREIGIRIALGARAGDVVASIFARPLVHVAVGVGLGCVLMGGLALLLTSDITTAAVVRHVALLGTYGLVMLAVCSLACAGPVIRALRVEPTDVLRDDG
jgi:putative ABC transport system permease protein